jgi:hypothetical protein
MAPRPSLLPSLVRIATTATVGFVLNLPFTPLVLDFLGVTTEQAASRVGGAVATAVALVYYAVVRFAEEKWRAGAGWLLLYANRPRYVPADTPDARLP